MKKYTSLEHTIKKVVAEQNYRNEQIDEAISPVDYDKPKEVPQAFFKPVHIQPRKGEAQIPAGGSTRARRNVEKEKSSETMHPDLKEEENNSLSVSKHRRRYGATTPPRLPPAPSVAELKVKYTNILRGVLQSVTGGAERNPEDVKDIADAARSEALRRARTPEARAALLKGFAKLDADRLQGETEQELGRQREAQKKALETPEGAGAKTATDVAQAAALARGAYKLGGEIKSALFPKKPSSSKKADTTPTAAPAAARVARTTPRDVTRQSFRNFLKKQEPSKTVELPGATISAPRTGLSTKRDTTLAANDATKPQTPETMGIVVKKQDIPGRKPSANENIPASEFTPPTPKGTGTEGLAPAPRANPKDRPRLKLVNKEKPKPEPKAEPEPVAPPKIEKPDKTPTGETVRLPGVEITAPSPGVSVPKKNPRPAKEQDNTPAPAAAPVTRPAGLPAPAAAPAAALAQQPSPGATPGASQQQGRTPGQNIQIVPDPRQNANTNKAISTRATEKGKGEGSSKPRRRLRLPLFGFGSGTDSPTPNARGGYQVSGTASRARSRIEFKEEMSRNDIEAVARKNTKRTDPVVGRPDSNRTKTMSRHAQIISKIIEDKKIIIKKNKEEKLGANPLVDTEPKLKHITLEQGSGKNDR